MIILLISLCTRRALSSTVHIVHEDGDVRMIALEGIQGDYDVRVNRGNLSIAVPDTCIGQSIIFGFTVVCTASRINKLVMRAAIVLKARQQKF